MKIKHVVLIGCAVIAVAAIFMFAGCSSSSDDSPPPVVITVTGASGTRWVPKVGDTLAAALPTGVESDQDFSWRYSSTRADYKSESADALAEADGVDTGSTLLSDLQVPAALAGKYLWVQNTVDEEAGTTIYSRLLGPVEEAEDEDP